MKAQEYTLSSRINKNTFRILKNTAAKEYRSFISKIRLLLKLTYLTSLSFWTLKFEDHRYSNISCVPQHARINCAILNLSMLSGLSEILPSGFRQCSNLLEFQNFPRFHWNLDNIIDFPHSLTFFMN